MLARASLGLRPILFPAATLVGLSRVRVGVHYSTDVIAGAVVGALVSRQLAPYFHSA